QENDEYGSDRIENEFDGEQRRPDAAGEPTVMRQQEIAEQDRQHQDEAVQYRHQNRRPTPLHLPAALGPQFGSRQRRIKRNNARADRRTRGRGVGRERHDGRDPDDRPKNEAGQKRLAAVKYARRVPDHAASQEPDGRQGQRERSAESGSTQRPERDGGSP